MIRFLIALTLTASAALGATTHTAANRTVATIQELHDSGGVVDGDTIVIPDGTEPWSTELAISKAITLQGGGIGTTIIENNTTSGTILSFTTVAGKSYRLTGIEFSDGPATISSSSTATVYLSGDSQAMVIDNCKWNQIGNEQIMVTGGVCGVIAECTVATSSGRIMLKNGQGAGDSYGDWAWERAAGHGTAAAMYIEDCTFSNTGSNQQAGMTDGWVGGRGVIRFNTMQDKRPGNHGTETSQRLRSGRLLEVYMNSNHIQVPGSTDTWYDLRGGTGFVWGNTITLDSGRNLNSVIKLNAYRVFNADRPWGNADGTKLWDDPDLTDTYGTAGDGIFESGTSESGGLRSLTDTDKAWGTNVWANHQLRVTTNFTAASGGVRSATVTSAGWTTNAWAGWEFTKTSDNSKGSVLSNTSDTLTLSTSSYAVNMTGGGAFVLSLGAVISSNTSTALTTSGTSDGPGYTYAAGQNYEIRKVTRVLDQAGAGATVAFTSSPPNHQAMSQGRDPVRHWLNTKDGANVTAATAAQHTIVANLDYYNWVPSGFDGTVGVGSGPIASRPATCTTGVAYWATDEGEWNSTNGATADGRLYVATATNTWTLAYTPYTYPHPLRVDAPADTTAPTLSSVSVDGATVTVGFSEAVSSMSAANWTFSAGSLSSLSGSGSSYTMTLSPAAVFGGSYTISYSPGSTVDAAANALASISAQAVTNNTADSGTPSTRNPGRRPRGWRVLSK